MKRLLATSAVVAALGAGAIATSAPAEPSAAATQKITASGVGGVKIGSSYAVLRKKGLIGKIRPGCELGGPNTRSAPLKKAKGFVNFTQKNPRRVTDISVTSGATAKGVGRGDTLADIKAAFPNATEEHGTDETFGVTLVRVPKKDGGKFVFAVDVDTGKVVQIGVPSIGFCE